MLNKFFNLFVSIVYADGITNPVLPIPGTGGQAAGPGIFGKIISALIGMFLLFGFILALFHLLFGAVRWITAGGDKTTLEHARDRIYQAIVGLIILVAVWALTVLISTFLGWDQSLDPNAPLIFPLPNIKNL